MFEITCSTTLFTVRTIPMVFVLEENDENEIVAQMIKHGGGHIASSRGPYGIYLSTPDNLQSLPNEALFSTEFIKDCCLANKILDINQYRLTDSSNYPDSFDVMEVLLRQSPWPETAERGENDLRNFDTNSDSDTIINSQRPRRNISSSQRAFSGDEEREILRYIVETKGIGLIQGEALWKKIAEIKVRGRTWRSVQKHFMKHMLPNITKYTFLSVTDRLEFQKQRKKIANSHDSEIRPLPSSSTPQRISLHKTARSGDAGSSSKVVSQRHVEEHRSDILPRISESPVRSDGSNLEAACSRRPPEKRKPFRTSRILEFSESDSGSCSGNEDDPKPKKRQFNRSTSSHVHHENDDSSHSKKQDDLQHSQKNKARVTQRQESVIDSSDSVDSASERHHRSLVVSRTNKEGRQQVVINSSEEEGSGSEQHYVSAVVERTGNAHRESEDNSSSDDSFWPSGREQVHGSFKPTYRKPRSIRKRRREEFTMEEEYGILRYLQKHNRFSNTGGNNVWKNMAATEPMGNRHTWQSLRERYLKKIVPNIHKYNISEDIKRRIKSK